MSSPPGTAGLMNRGGSVVGDNRMRVGLSLAVFSALCFGLSGPFAKSLIATGWTPAAAVGIRLGIGALIAVVLVTIIDRTWVRSAWRHRGVVLAYGLIAVAGAQLCYFNAVSYLPVGVALLLEYLGPILVIGWVWLTTRNRPAAATLLGGVLAVLGALIVLDVFGDISSIHPVGVLWALGAAVCLAFYFIAAGQEREGLGPWALTAGGLVVGGAAIFALGAVGVLQLRFATADVTIAGTQVSVVVAVGVLAIITAAISYGTGIAAVRKLQPTLASLIALTEVIFAVLAAWLLLGEALTPVRMIGGLVLLAGVALARVGESRVAERTAAVAARPEAALPSARPERTVDDKPDTKPQPALIV